MKAHIILILLVLAGIFTACSSEPQYEKGNFPGKYREMSEEERQLIQEERQQIAITACAEKGEGESCVTENQRGDVEGSCQIQEDNLICVFDGQGKSEGLQSE